MHALLTSLAQDHYRIMEMMGQDMQIRGLGVAQQNTAGIDPNTNILSESKRFGKAPDRALRELHSTIF
jgi:hypothetical protein